MYSSDNSTIDFNKFIDSNTLDKWHIYCLNDIATPAMSCRTKSWLDRGVQDGK